MNAITENLWLTQPRDFLDENYLLLKSIVADKNQVLQIILRHIAVLLKACDCTANLIYPFSTNVSFLYPQKTSENLQFSDVFRGYKSRTLVENGLILKFIMTYDQNGLARTVDIFVFRKFSKRKTNKQTNKQRRFRFSFNGWFLIFCRGTDTLNHIEQNNMVKKQSGVLSKSVPWNQYGLARGNFTLPAGPYISESCIKNKSQIKFLFSHFFVVSPKV